MNLMKRPSQTMSALFLSLLCASLFAASVGHADEVVPLIEDNVATQARVDVIQRAKKEILVEYFYVGGDDYSLGGMTLLVEAARKGVSVKVILDSIFGKIPLPLYAKLMEQAVGPDGVSNLEIKVYNPIGLNPFNWSHRSHAKLLIADQGESRVLISGGRNVGGEYFGIQGKRNFDDFDVLTRGSIAEAARKNFYDNWHSGVAKPVQSLGIEKGKVDPLMCVNREDLERCEATQHELQKKIDADEVRLKTIFEQIVNYNPGDSVISHSKIDWFKKSFSIAKTRFMSHDPTGLVSKETATLSRDLLAILRSAQTDVNIISPYLIPTDGVYTAFQELRAKGVRIRIITNSMKSTDNLLAQAGYRSSQKRLREMGIEIWEYVGPNTVHAKTAIIDHNHVLVGTYNMDPRSAFLNREVGMSFIDDENTGFASMHEQTIEGFRQRSMLVAKDGIDYNQEWQSADISFLTKTKLNLLRFVMPFIKSQI